MNPFWVVDAVYRQVAWWWVAVLSGQVKCEGDQ